MIDLLVAVGQIVAIPTFLLTLYLLLSPKLFRTKISFIAERQIQVLKATAGETPMIAFNILTILVANGPISRWETLRFERAFVTFPDDRTFEFNCRAYLNEIGRGQSNQSRNIPIALQGGESRTITTAFQTHRITDWLAGIYTFIIETSDSRGAETQSGKFKFILTEDNLQIIAGPAAAPTREARPGAMLMIELID